MVVQPLSKYVGRNDKCMVKVKLTKKGSQAPQREAGVDEETKKKMMAYWHKKQEVLSCFPLFPPFPCYLLVLYR